MPLWQQAAWGWDRVWVRGEPPGDMVLYFPAAGLVSEG